MAIKSFATAATLVVTALLVASCGGSSPAAPTVSTNPVPTITTLSPASVVAADLRASGAANITVTITGTGFIDGSVVLIDGTDQGKLTTFAGSTQLRTVIATATVLSTQGSRTITVFNPSPGGGTSNALLLTVR
jgi:hypothetical protein